MEVKLSSPKMHCEGCLKTITRTLKHIKGVQKVDVDLTTKTAVVDYDPAKTDPEEMLAKLAGVNYQSTVIS
jgi:copper chaperone CopZ